MIRTVYYEGRPVKLRPEDDPAVELAVVAYVMHANDRHTNGGRDKERAIARHMLEAAGVDRVRTLCEQALIQAEADAQTDEHDPATAAAAALANEILDVLDHQED